MKKKYSKKDIAWNIAYVVIFILCLISVRALIESTTNNRNPIDYYTCTSIQGSSLHYSDVSDDIPESCSVDGGYKYVNPEILGCEFVRSIGRYPEQEKNCLLLIQNAQDKLNN